MHDLLKDTNKLVYKLGSTLFDFNHKLEIADKIH